MSKKVLILSGSPRKGGKSDLLCDEFMRGAIEAGHEVEKIRVQEKKVAYCSACYACQDTGVCAIKDDMAEIMQKMIDEQFTPATGIEVDISIMPDQYKLVLANSAGNAPDVATGINYTVPYELAVRGALVDMAQFDDFKDAAKPYEPGFFLTGTIGEILRVL